MIWLNMRHMAVNNCHLTSVLEFAILNMAKTTHPGPAKGHGGFYIGGKYDKNRESGGAD